MLESEISAVSLDSGKGRLQELSATARYVVPAQALAGATKYKDLSNNDNFWALHNWSFGLR